MKKTLWIITAALVLPLSVFANHHGDEGYVKKENHSHKAMIHQENEHGMHGDMKQMMNQCVHGDMGKEDCMTKHGQMQEHKHMKGMHGDEKHHMMQNMHGGDGTGHKSKALKDEEMKPDHSSDEHKH